MADILMLSGSYQNPEEFPFFFFFSRGISVVQFRIKASFELFVWSLFIAKDSFKYFYLHPDKLHLFGGNTRILSVIVIILKFIISYDYLLEYTLGLLALSQENLGSGGSI